MSETPVIINSFVSPIQIKNLIIEDSSVSINTLQFMGTLMKINNLGIRLPGIPGESAYEAAIKGGYIGSKEEFYEDITTDIETLTNQDIEELMTLCV